MPWSAEKQPRMAVSLQNERIALLQDVNYREQKTAVKKKRRDSGGTVRFARLYGARRDRMAISFLRQITSIEMVSHHATRAGYWVMLPVVAATLALYHPQPTPVRYDITATKA
jgi:hypothetical protein